MAETPCSLPKHPRYAMFAKWYDRYMALVGLMAGVAIILQAALIIENQSSENASLPSYILLLIVSLSLIIYGLLWKNFHDDRFGHGITRWLDHGIGGHGVVPTHQYSWCIFEYWLKKQMETALIVGIVCGVIFVVAFAWIVYVRAKSWRPTVTDSAIEHIIQTKMGGRGHIAQMMENNR